jgi:hypothetical protein
MSRKTNRPRREMEERRMVKMMVMSAQATR